MMVKGCTATATAHPVWWVLLSPPSPCPILPTPLSMPCIAALPTQLRSHKTCFPVNIPPLQHPGCLQGVKEALLGAQQHLDPQTPQRRRQLPARLCLWPLCDLNTAVSCHLTAAGDQHQCRHDPHYFGLLRQPGQGSASVGGRGLTTAPFWHCCQGIPSTQPSFLPLEGSTRSHTTPPHCQQQDPHAAPLPPTSAQLLSFISHFPLLLLFFAASPARPCFLLPLDHTSYSTFAISLLLTALSIIHFHKIPPSSFNFYFPSHLLQTALHLMDSKDRERGTKKPSLNRQVPPPLHLWALPFLKCRDLF